MAKKKKGIFCKNCNFEVIIGEPSDLDNLNKEWPFVAPMPDKDGKVTITQMATWSCPKCGKTIRGARGKTKGDFDGKSKKVQIEEKLAENVEFDIEVFANSMGAEKENLEKMLNFMIKKGIAKGKIEGDMYKPL
ncbi:MAG: hypothetical protein INQ03_14950 [Candidatus Heimdallarchaeota archaeon]|nr:hypothetical protein [Candidatus Heimdallarchaeota archaeon]